jgi:hypothetical protein
MMVNFPSCPKDLTFYDYTPAIKETWQGILMGKSRINGGG